MPNWTKEQKLAIDTENSNILVSAGAGSGKTAVLSERTLRKVKEGTDIDKILILTFTNAAAYEMMIRIRNKLEENNLLDQVSLIDKAFITTFDSFSLSIVKKYHDRLNLTKDINIIDENSVSIIKAKFLDDIFEEYYLSKDKKFDKLISDFCLKNDRDLKEDILKLSKDLDLKYDKSTYLEEYINNYYSDTFINNSFKEYEDVLLDSINNIKSNLEELSASLDTDYMDKFYEALNPILNCHDYDSIKNNNYVSISNIRLPKGSSSLSKYRASIKDSLDLIKELTLFSKEELIEGYKSTKEYLEIIIDIINTLDEKITSYKTKYNSFEFVDISKLAISLVKNNPDIKEELTNSFVEIMIDEYQDTSDLQEEFISLISNNNVYMVGDIKQSIYRFRNANPNIFKEKYLEYEKNNGGIKIDLNKNFRSREEVLNDINTIFNDIMSITYGGADYYNSHQLSFGNTSYIEKGKTEQSYDLEIKNYTLDKEDYNNFSKDEIEIFTIALDILDKINNHYMIYDKDKNILREASFSDFVILLDRATKFNLYKKIFEYLNIPLTLYKDIDISDNDEVYLIKNILKMIANFNNINDSFTYGYISVARSYLFRLSDSEIFNTITNKDYSNSIIYKKIESIINDLDLLDLKSLIKRIIDEFNFNEKMLTVSSIVERIAVLDKIINLSDTLSKLDYDYIMFIDYLDNILKDKNKKIEVPLSVDSDNSVKIMTIHKSKGLEYNVCYYAGLSNKFNISELKEKILFNSKYGIIVPSYINGYSDTFIKYLVKKDYLIEEISEKIRLFYVALTRCKEKMIVLTNFNEDDISLDDNIKNTYRSFNDILNSVKDKLYNYTTNIDISKLGLTKDYLSIDINKDINIDNNYKLEVNELNIDNTILEEEHFSKTISRLSTKEEKDNMKYGTRVHELFELIDFKNVDFTNLDITDKEKEYINNFLNQDLLKDINNANILKEYEFYYNNKHGIIDLMLEYSDHVDIIDYKLKHVDDLEYLKQLNGYKEYIILKTNMPVNIYLYSILDDNIKQV